MVQGTRTLPATGFGQDDDDRRPAHVAADQRALMRAHATLTRGAGFVIDDALQVRSMREIRPSITRSRMLGNRLRELDRFLSVVVDEAALYLDRPDHDARAFARLRNTPHKLGLLHDMMAYLPIQRADMRRQRLRAVGRISACLHHCAGTVHAASLYVDVALTRAPRRPGAASAHEVPGICAQPLPVPRTMLQLPAAALLDIGRLYRDIGDDLVAKVLPR